MADDIQLEVVTPDRRFLSTRVSSVTAPGVFGEFGVLPGHVPFMTPLGTGVLTYKNTDGTGYLVVSQGFAEISENKVTILAESADLAAEIDSAKAQADIKTLEEQLKGKGEVDPEFKRLKADLDRASSKVVVSGRK